MNELPDLTLASMGLTEAEARETLNEIARAVEKGEASMKDVQRASYLQMYLAKCFDLKQYAEDHGLSPKGRTEKAQATQGKDDDNDVPLF